MRNMNVLVTGLGGPIAQGIMMGLAELDNVTIIGADRRELTSGHHFCDRTYQVPRYSDLNAYKKAILDIVEKENIEAIFPGLHDEVEVYAEFRDEIPAKVALPISNHFDVLNNKNRMYNFLNEKGLEQYVPEHFSFKKNADLEAILAEHYSDTTYVVVKPAETYGAIGLAILCDREHYLEAISKNLKKYVAIDDYLDIEQFDNTDRFVMPFLTKDEYSVDLYLSEGKVVAAVPRKRVGVSSGIVLEGRVENNTDVIEAAPQVASTLVTDGFINLQFFETDKGYKLVDVNPRFCGSQVMSLGAGVNFPEIFLKDAVLNEHVEANPIWDTVMYRYRMPKFYHDSDIQL